MQLTRVTNCVLVLDADDDNDLDELVIEVTSFTLTFEINQLPQAVITPAFGREIMTGAISDLSAALEGRTGSLIAVINGVTTTFLEGFVGQVTTSRSANVVGSDNLSAQIVLKHKLQLLAGSPAASLVYSSGGTDPVNSYYNRATVSMFGVSKELLESTWESLARELYGNRPSANVFLFPGHVILDMLVAVMLRNMPDIISSDELRERIQVYAPANFMDYPLDTNLIGKMLGLLFQEKVVAGNLWEAVLTSAQEFFLNIIPYATGIALANPIAALDQEQIVINASELITAQPSRMSSGPETIRGVIAEMTSGAREGAEATVTESIHLFAYPPMVTREGAVAVNIMQTDTLRSRGGYYRWWKAPAWLNGDAGMSESVKTLQTSGNARLKGASLTSAFRREYLASLGPVLAKMIYAQLLRNNLQVPELVLPYRTDLMPGTTIKLVNGTSVISGLGFSGRDWYGMITSVRFDLSNDGDPMLQTVISLSYPRPTQTLPGTQQVGYAEGSLFEGAWKGIKLDGSDLTEAPDSREFPGNPTN